MEQLVLALGVLVVLFLIGRAIMLWYWKVDEQITLLKDIRQSLRDLAAQTPAPAVPQASRPVPPPVPSMRQERIQTEAEGVPLFRESSNR